ncbi:MAG: glycoside hydrolase family 9 protein, partial [Fibrobacterota bacterium]|nr:glycoside hydrolase family 9 protein [Fibrobacterota bacterium]
DLSMVYGIGAKTPNHPHHRGANPEGKNFPGAFYRYNPPVGALYGGFPPTTSIFKEDWNDYRHSESCLDGTTALLLPAVGLSVAEPPLAPPVLTVEILSVDQTEALIRIRQSRYGTAVIRYGTSKATLGSVAPGLEAGVEHRISLKGLSPGTTYYFEAEAVDTRGIRAVNDNGGEKWSFTTLKNPKEPARISQVSACNITADSADIIWFTPNGEYGSQVTYGNAKPPSLKQSGDVASQPVRFHRIRIGGLKEKTQYWFSVESDGSKDDNQGKFYTFTTPVTYVAFEIRAMQYSGIGPFPYLGINVVNNDVKAYDSLDLRIYLRGTEAEMQDFGAAVDIGIQYTEAGFQGTPFKAELDKLVQAQKLVKMEDTFVPATGTYIWYLSLPLGSVVMKSGSRFRMDVGFRKRNLPFDDNLLYGPPTHVPTPLDWSWSAHSRALGDPVDFPGIPTGTKDDLDNFYFLHPQNPYITVYRKGEFIYGYSPSRKEQQTKVSHYEMTSRITSPIANPPEEHLLLKQPASVLNITGTASVTENGRLTDIWLNGQRLEDISKVAKYDPAANSYTFNIPVPLKAGSNVVDLTLFGGAEAGCNGCSGCAFSNHHFFVDFRKSDAFPSHLKLLTPTGDPLPTLGEAGKTQFQVEVEDKSGDRSDLPDTLRVTVSNANRGDAFLVTLVETGPRTSIFHTLTPLNLVDIDPTIKTPGQVPFGEGDTVWVTYRDRSDPEDSSQAFLFSPATYPLAVGGSLYDTDGDGVADKARVLYSKPLTQIPDSIQIAFPVPTEIRFARGSKNIYAGPSGNQVELDWSPPFPVATAFVGESRNSGRSFLTEAGKARSNAFTFVDSIGPILKKAVLAPGRNPGEADTLSLEFSEPVVLSPGSRNPLRVIRGKELEAGSLEWVRTLLGQDLIWKILVASHSDPLLMPGDSLRLGMGYTDLGGVKPHPQNRPVILEGDNRVPPPIVRLRFLPASQGFFSEEVDASGQPAFIAARSDGARWQAFAGATRE